jgi:hypothetical protein
MQAWMVAGAMLVVCAGSAAGGDPVEPAELRGVSVREAAELEIRIELSAPVVPYARELAGTPGLEPSRLYLDLHGTVLPASVAREVEGKGAVRRVRIGQHDTDTTRVVIELVSPRPFALERRGTQVVIRFAPAPRAVALREEPARLAVAAMAEPPVPAARGAGRGADEEPARTERDRAASTKARVSSSSTVGAAASELEAQVGRLHRRRDWSALLVLYAGGSPIGDAAPASVRAAIADAFLAVGLPERADEVLGAPGRDEPAVLRLARAEIALARRDSRALRALLASVEQAPLGVGEARRLERLRIRAALAEGASSGAAAIVVGWTAELRRALARSTIETAEAAAAVGAYEQAAADFRRARDASDAPALRAAAASGMLRAALELGDEPATAEALRALAGEPQPLVQSVTRSLAARSGVRLEGDQAQQDEGER